jgi:hypothetical protein
MSPLLFNFRTEINGAHQLLVYADDANLLGDKVNIIQKDTRSLTDAGKKVRLDVNAEKTMYMLTSLNWVQWLF